MTAERCDVARATTVTLVVVLAVLAVVTPAIGTAGTASPTWSMNDTDVGAVDAADARAVGGTNAAAGPAVAGNATCAYPLTVEDATGTNVTVPERPERVVSLAPAAAQTLWALDASDAVVGVSDYASYLPGADGKTVVSERQGREYYDDVIADLDPDVVLAPHEVDPEVARTLRSEGLTVYYVGQTRDLAGVVETVELVGRLAGECEAAVATATDMRRRLAAVREAVSDEPRPGALYYFDGFSWGNETVIGSVLTTAGTENLLATAGVSDFRELDDQFVADRRTAVEWLVLENVPGTQPSGAPYNRTTAMQSDQVVVLDTYNVRHPVPGVVAAVENLTRAVHPAAYEEAQSILASTENATTVTSPRSTATSATAAGPTTTAVPTVPAGTSVSPSPDATTAGSSATPGTGATASVADVDGTGGTGARGTGTAGGASGPATLSTTGGSGPGFTALTAALVLLAAGALGRPRIRRR